MSALKQNDAVQVFDVEHGVHDVHIHDSVQVDDVTCDATLVEITPPLNSGGTHLPPSHLSLLCVNPSTDYTAFQHIIRLIIIYIVRLTLSVS